MPLEGLQKLWKIKPLKFEDCNIITGAEIEELLQRLVHEARDVYPHKDVEPADLAKIIML